jgi:Flp pilus assembly protein TadG
VQQQDQSDFLADDRGQTAVFTTLMIAVLFAFAAVVVDSGLWMLTKRNLQGNADAAAMAAGTDLASSNNQAMLTARDYVQGRNTDGANLDGVQYTNNNSRMRVTVSRVTAGPFMSFFSFLTGEDKVAPTIKARSTVEIAQYSGGPGMLPIGIMKDAYTIGQNTEAKFDDPGNGNRGLLEPDNLEGVNCVDSNPQDIYDMISQDGTSCAYPIGTNISTMTGNKTGPTLTAFDDRIPTTDKDRFEDVFEYDPRSGRYIAKKPDSPRIGFVPVIENTDGTTAWPNGKKEVRVLRYLMVYIGNRDDAPNYRPTPNGKSTYLTPVDAILPESFNRPYTTVGFDRNNPDGPMLVHLVE